MTAPTASAGKTARRVRSPRPGRGNTLRGPLTSRIAYLFVLPALLVFAVFTIAPTIYTFVISTFQFNRLNPSMSKFAGAKNYIDLISNQTVPPFWSTVWVSLYFTGAMVIGGTVIGLLCALLLQRGGMWLASMRTMIFLPHVTPLIATSLVWVWIFNPQFGLANAILHVFGIPNIDFLHDSRWAMPAVILYSLWHESGFVTIVFLGGLTTISGDLSEAAKLDGATRWQEFWYITFPQLRPVIALVVLISSVSSLQAFTQFFTMTGGGPGSSYATSTLGFQLYQQQFVFSHTGYAAALAVVLFLVTAALGLIQLRVQNGDRPARASRRAATSSLPAPVTTHEKTGMS